MSAKKKSLDPGYSAQFHFIERREWDDALNRFSDANIYQTLSYDAVRFGEKKVEHMVLRSEGKIVAAAQARLVIFPVPRLGAAYLRWAPVWRIRNEPPDPAVLRQALRALRNEYVWRRRMILRIFPYLFDDASQDCLEIMAEEGYSPVPDEDPGRTLIMDIGQPLEDIRKKLDQKWRNCLNKSERNGLEVVEGTDDGLFSDFIGLYRAMLDRKKFPEPNDINEFRAIQKDLSEADKMRVFISRAGGRSSAGAICSAIGDTGVYLFGATNDEGMTNKGSYLLQWKAIQWMQDRGCLFYNLNGVNPEKNPGGYHFKVGLLGKNGRDVNYLGRFDSYPDQRTARLVRIADRALPAIKRVIGKMRKSRSKDGSKPAGG